MLKSSLANNSLADLITASFYRFYQPDPFLISYRSQLKVTEPKNFCM